MRNKPKRARDLSPQEQRIAELVARVERLTLEKSHLIDWVARQELELQRIRKQIADRTLVEKWTRW